MKLVGKAGGLLALCTLALVIELAFGCTTGHLTSTPMPSEFPQLVVSVYGDWGSSGNNTMFVLFENGEVLSRLAPQSTNSIFTDFKLDEEEKGRFLQSVKLDDLSELQRKYTRLTSDALIWVVETWKDGRSVRVQANAGMGCVDGQITNRASDSQIPAAFINVIEKVCQFRGNGKPWAPTEFELRWVKVSALQDSSRAPTCPWPKTWDGFVPPADASGRAVTTKAPGSQLGAIQGFLSDCARNGRVVAYDSSKFSVSTRFELPAENRWSHGLITDPGQ
jgi:hypothetical protein